MQQLRSLLRKALEQREKTARRDALAAVQEAAKTYGFSLNDLVGAGQQAAHHAPQLQLYGRGLSQALGLPVRERLVLFTALGRTVPV